MAAEGQGQFWLNWWVNAVAAVATVAAVLVALFAEAFRGKFYPPKLSLSLVAVRGEAAEARDQAGRSSPVRFYHLRAENARRWSSARNVQVALLRVQQDGPDGRLQDVWQGDVPFRWRHQELFPLLRTIGHASDVDLCSVSPGASAASDPLQLMGDHVPILRLHLVLEAFNLPLEYTGPTRRVLTVQARGSEADSPPVRVRIAWNGQWNAGEAEMGKHLVVEVLS